MTRRVKQLKDIQDVEKWMIKAKRLIKMSKTIHKTLYQLAFIYTSGNDVMKKEAFSLMTELIEMGVVSAHDIEKVIHDVERWRKYRYREGDVM